MTVLDSLKDTNNKIIDNMLSDLSEDIEKRQWQTRFAKCLNAITKLPQLYIEARRYDPDHNADMIKVIQFYCMEYFNTRDIYDHTEFYTYYRNNVLPLPRLRNRIIYMK